MRNGLMLAVGVLTLSGCWTDPATRLAYDLEAAAGRVGSAEGSTYALVHHTPSHAGECDGPYRIQADKVGAIIVWCRDVSGTATLSSHSTSYHSRFVATPETFIVDKQAREDLIVLLERRDGRVVISSVR